MKITKHKTDRPGVWAIRVDGRDTPLTIWKGEEKRWGDWQEWHLMKGDHQLMTQRRVGDILYAIETLLGALGVTEAA